MSFSLAEAAIPVEPDGLAPFAVRGNGAADRRFDEPGHAFRSPFARDRDRIVHSRAFRRLEYKTQVFLNGSGDHYRTRMTHTIEVVAIARTLARGLRVNEDLTEAIALAHDLGHTPFGHVGERILDRLLHNDGGFEHNRQSLRVVDHIEKKYPGFDGLNLTRAVRDGLVKRRGETPTLDGLPLAPFPSVEAQIADLADDVAYYAHDVDDGVASGLLLPEQLAGVEFWRRARQRALDSGGDPSAEYFPAYVVRCLIDMLVGDIVPATEARLAKHAPASPEDAGNCRSKLVGFSDAFRAGSKQFRDFLFEKLYWHTEVLDVNHRAERAVRGLFDYFLANPEEMGSGTRRRAPEAGLRRAVGDYIAGMTDLYAIEQYREKTGNEF
jgi:dGTPase